MSASGTSKPAVVSCDGKEAVARARGIVGRGGQYLLGTGDYHPIKGTNATDLPWTEKGGEQGSDCAGFAICWAWKLQRHRPGFNVGAWASVSDDINCNSALEDGLHKQELFVTCPEGEKVMPGDLLLYPTIRIKDKDGDVHTFIGHVGLVENVPLDFKYGDWRRLGIIQCHGPNHYKPGVVRSDGSIWAHHDTLWGKPEHRSRIVRPRSR
jgi:hypothetical protein